MERGEGDLGRPREVEPVLLERIDVGALGGEEARAVHRLLAHQYGRDHRREARLGEMLEGELVERHRHPRRIADDVAEACSRDAGGALHVEAADLRVLARLREDGRLADAPELLGVLLRVAVRCRRMRRIGDERQRRVARGFRGCEPFLGLLELGLHGLELLELLRCRLALELRPPPELVHARDELAPALVGLEQRVELLGRALPCERLTPGVGIAAASLEVDHEVESRLGSQPELRSRESPRPKGAACTRYLPATEETYAATSARCWSVRLVPNEGIPPWPFVTRS